MRSVKQLDYTIGVLRILVTAGETMDTLIKLGKARY
jgi:hypothetical protein